MLFRSWNLCVAVGALCTLAVSTVVIGFYVTGLTSPYLKNFAKVSPTPGSRGLLEQFSTSLCARLRHPFLMFLVGFATGVVEAACMVTNSKCGKQIVTPGQLIDTFGGLLAAVYLRAGTPPATPKTPAQAMTDFLQTVLPGSCTRGPAAPGGPSRPALPAEFASLGSLPRQHVESASTGVARACANVHQTLDEMYQVAASHLAVAHATHHVSDSPATPTSTDEPAIEADAEAEAATEPNAEAAAEPAAIEAAAEPTGEPAAIETVGGIVHGWGGAGSKSPKDLDFILEQALQDAEQTSQGAAD